MKQSGSDRAMTLIGVFALALTVGVMVSRRAAPPKLEVEEMRDAVAAPMSPAMLGGVRVIRPELGYFASPAVRRAEAERALLSSRMSHVSRAMHARAARLRSRPVSQ